MSESDDWFDVTAGIDPLLRVPREEDNPPATEAELDAEFDSIMSFLDNLDEEQAAELDDVATRARNDLGSPVEEHTPDSHADQQLQKPRVQLWQIIRAPSDPPVRIDATPQSKVNSRVRFLANMELPLGLRAVLVTQLTLMTVLAVTLMLTAYDIVQALLILATVSTAGVLLARLRKHK